MSYRVRRQAITGKLILQHDMTSGPDGLGIWSDAHHMPGDFIPVAVEEYQDTVIKLEMQRDRIARYERRAEAQRTARAARANRQPKEIAT